jgi:hypothetical protein
VTIHAAGIANARKAHSARCRQRVIKALNDAVTNGEEISVSTIARRAGVDRSFLYRHRDLHATVLAKAAEPPTSPAGGPSVSRASLIADLANAHNHVTRLTRENTQLQRRLSEHLGDQIWCDAGLSTDHDVDLKTRIIELEHAAADLRRQLSEREEDLAAARATNRELMIRINQMTATSPGGVSR